MLDQTMIAATDLPLPANLAQVALLAGTTILTLGGEKRAEDLMPGDRIVTRDCGTSVLVNVSHARVDVATVRIKTGAIGPATPTRDIALPSETVLHLRHGRMATPVSARDLAVTDSATLVERSLSTLVSLFFQRPHVIYADGIELWAAPA